MNIRKEINRLNDVAAQVEDLINDYESEIDLVLNNLQESSYPHTYLALYIFSFKLKSLRYGIFQVAKAKELYTVKALYRIFLEHFLKAVYIYARYCDEQTDDAGSEYYFHSKAGEDLAYVKSLKAKSNMLNDVIDFDEFELLKEVHPKLNITDRGSLKQVTDRFNYKNIVKYLLKSFHDADNGERNFLSNIIIAYSDLSSFVHGGPTSEKVFNVMTNNKLLKTELFDICEMATGLTIAMQNFTFLTFYHENENLHDLCVRISEVHKTHLGRTIE